MAKIKGFELKALKTGVGHDGGGVQANIYFENKKVGILVDEGYGSGLEVTFLKDKETMQSIVDKTVLREDLTPYGRLDKFFGDLVELTIDEKEFKKNC